MRKISEAEYDEIVKKTKVIESDKFGEKVLLYEDGNYMKLFRRKRLFSSALIYPYWLRFVWNTAGLKKMKIPTFASILEVVKVPHSKKTAVIYEPLLGETIKHLLLKGEFGDDMISKLGTFVAEIQKRGVYFSALHLGNIVLTPEGEFGLIDISDMRLVYFPIPLFTLKTNMRYFFHSRQGLKFLKSEKAIDLFVSAYLANITKWNRKKMEKFLALQKDLLKFDN